MDCMLAAGNVRRVKQLFFHGSMQWLDGVGFTLYLGLFEMSSSSLLMFSFPIENGWFSISIAFFYSNIFEKKRKILNEPGPVNGNWNVSFSLYPIELFLLVGKSWMFMHQRHTASNIDHHLFSDVSLDRTSFLNQLWCNHRNHQTLSGSTLWAAAQATRNMAASRWTCSFSQYKCLL